jgi:RNA polymerase sigma factor (sigma-70 family)
VRYSRGCHDLCRFQFDLLRPEIIEQSRSRSEKHWHETKPDFVDEPGAHPETPRNPSQPTHRSWRHTFPPRVFTQMNALPLSGRTAMLDRPPLVIAHDAPPPGILMTDALLVARAQRDPAAFAPLYEAYFDPVYRYCYHRLGSWEAAEDATSVIFTNALAALPRYRAGSRSGSFRSWLFAIAHNVVVNEYRAGSRRTMQSLVAAADVPDATVSLEETAIAAEASQTLHALLARLSPEQRQVVELRLAGLTAAEIGGVLGRKHAAIRATQYRAAIRLRALLGLARGESQDA